MRYSEEGRQEKKRKGNIEEERGSGERERDDAHPPSVNPGSNPFSRKQLKSQVEQTCAQKRTNVTTADRTRMRECSKEPLLLNPPPP
jgi:hypothetical protein